MAEKSQINIIATMISVLLTLVGFTGVTIFRNLEKRVDKNEFNLEQMHIKTEKINLEQKLNIQNREYLQKNFEDLKNIMSEMTKEVHNIKSYMYRIKTNNIDVPKLSIHSTKINERGNVV